jgi:pimeloyl-ACP methyl ester carboxylesterase
MDEGRFVTTPPHDDAIRQLNVPGASLFYEVRGSGPALLMIPGGAADADIFARVLEYLTDRFTVVLYDPRGISRSHIEGEAEDVPVEVHADDASRLLQAIGAAPAYVFGSSGGGVIGLALAARYPDQVRTIVAHEPPVIQLLAQGEPARTGMQEVAETYRREGAAPAMRKFGAVTGLGGSRGESDAEMVEAMGKLVARMQQNVEFFLAHYMLPITEFMPDLDALRALGSRLVVGIGEDTGGQLANETALALANRLGAPPVTFPGGHTGFLTHPQPFADKLAEILQAH